MSANVINAMLNLIEHPITDLQSNYVAKNRANGMGEALERYVQDLFINGFNLDEMTRLKRIEEHFSYIGNDSNPPDAMLKGGDAIEIKKTESRNADIALNSSYPKAKLNIDHPMLTAGCKVAESWHEKDMLYAIGTVAKNTLESLVFVYGEDYAADEATYQAVKTRIKQGVETIEGIEFTPTKELGKINRIDPLGITYLRVRGMWGIQNPYKVFNYVYQRDFSNKFNFMAVINAEKWSSFENTEQLVTLIKNTANASITDIEIKCPNNPARLKPAKLISFFI
ncbi:NgoPII restriction endonuclease [Acinetobacter marinus]|uniref:NgoPII restriction endonuclease n=1 Tax=Acinetobacter marinus TaxID=281375 RepID=A0A1G6KNM7_9GAMM|nr:NgoPII family restriction endonuclease [Acinetobacter marinus]SDC32660.1 NgoPII restriction endonuclease [Acinetobacter marinus]